MLIFRRTIVLVQHLGLSLSLGDCSGTQVTRGFVSDDTRCCDNTIVLKMSIIVLETCRGM